MDYSTIIGSTIYPALFDKTGSFFDFREYKAVWLLTFSDREQKFHVLSMIEYNINFFWAVNIT